MSELYISVGNLIFTPTWICALYLYIIYFFYLVYYFEQTYCTLYALVFHTSVVSVCNCSFRTANYAFYPHMMFVCSV